MNWSEQCRVRTELRRQTYSNQCVNLNLLSVSSRGGAARWQGLPPAAQQDFLLHLKKHRDILNGECVLLVHYPV